MFSLPFPALPFGKAGLPVTEKIVQGYFLKEPIGKKTSTPSQKRTHGDKDKKIKVLF